MPLGLVVGVGMHARGYLTLETCILITVSYTLVRRDIPDIDGHFETNVKCQQHSDVIMSAMASRITSVLNVCSTVCLGVNHRKYQSSAWLVFVRGIHRWPLDYLRKGSVTWKMFSFDDGIMAESCTNNTLIDIVANQTHFGDKHHYVMTSKRFPHHWSFVWRIRRSPLGQ